MTVKQVLRVRRHKGYEVRTELIDGQPYGCPDVQVKNAYTPDGKYIGDSKMAYQIVACRGIAPEYRTPESGVCTIGFSAKDQKWYGWSHRAIFGFAIGYRLEEGIGDFPAGYQIQNLDEARQCAVLFAESVS